MIQFTFFRELIEGLMRQSPLFHSVGFAKKSFGRTREANDGGAGALAPDEREAAKWSKRKLL